MSSKDSILASIRHHTGTRHEMPELTLEAITYADKLATFSEVLVRLVWPFLRTHKPVNLCLV